MRQKQPFLITLDTIQTFLKRYAKKRLPFTIIEIIERDEVSKYSNANYLWRVVVRTAHGREVLFVKQARGYNKRAWLWRQRFPVKSLLAWSDIIRVAGKKDFLSRDFTALVLPFFNDPVAWTRKRSHWQALKRLAPKEKNMLLHKSFRFL